MQNRFKFRFWSVEDGKFVDKWADLMSVDGTAEPYENAKDGAYKVCKEVICEQCTGLQDENGKLIYEGDIIRVFGYVDCFHTVCVFRNGCFELYHINGRPYNFIRQVSPIEIIGNIHENADLLEESK